jgi:hypothetical protein
MTGTRLLNAYCFHTAVLLQYGSSPLLGMKTKPVVRGGFLPGGSGSMGFESKFAPMKPGQFAASQGFKPVTLIPAKSQNASSSTDKNPLRSTDKIKDLDSLVPRVSSDTGHPS